MNQQVKKSIRRELRLIFRKIVTLTIICGIVILLLSCTEEITAPFPVGLGQDMLFENHIEVELGFENEGAVLYGKMYLPVGNGPFPVMVHHFGSDRWTTFAYSSEIQAVLDQGLGMFFYDKRGVGKSQGTCCPYYQDDYFPLLAGDIKAAIKIIKIHHLVDSTRIGLYGFSQGGWIVPIVAADSNMNLKWVVVGSGPTVTLGEEVYYSKISGDDDCINVNVSEEQLLEMMDQVGPSGFNPAPYIEKIKCPTIWVYGGLDRSIPVRRSIEILNRIKNNNISDFTIILKEN